MNQIFTILRRASKRKWKKKNRHPWEIWKDKIEPEATCWTGRSRKIADFPYLKIQGRKFKKENENQHPSLYGCSWFHEGVEEIFSIKDKDLLKFNSDPKFELEKECVPKKSTRTDVSNENQWVLIVTVVCSKFKYTYLYYTLDDIITVLLILCCMAFTWFPNIGHLAIRTTF